VPVLGVPDAHPTVICSGVANEMKFGALLRTSAGEVPELQELFTAYKELKKHLKVRVRRRSMRRGT
jgi:hypothetical protein